MKVTNKLNLPKPFELFMQDSESQHRFHPSVFSVTELLLPIRMILLKRKYHEEIERDVSDSIPALFGTAVHSVLEKYTNVECAEVQVSVNFGSYTLSGRIDNIDISAQTIIDYKTTNCSKINRKDFEDWRMQGLIYAYLVYRKTGIIMRKLKFIALLKDWSKIKAVPPNPIYIYEYEINDSDYDYIEDWLRKRFAKIEYYLTGEELPECDEVDRWYTGTKYAVYIGSHTKAKAVFDNQADAEMFVKEKGGEIEERIGDNIRCNYYCEVCKFCRKEK